MLMQKFDMHCHTKEGSFDAHVPIAKVANILKDKGFSGMLVTDHDSFDGYGYYEKNMDTADFPDDFIILKGMEYSTQNAGHFIIVLPDNVNSDMIGYKGMKVEWLENEIHSLGGILGPAHPYMPGGWAFCDTWFGRDHKDFLEKVDFIETYNSTINPVLNVKAEMLAMRYGKFGTGGSDAHFEKDVGHGCLSFEGKMIRNNDDLIKAVKEHAKATAGGEITAKMLRRRNTAIQKIMDGAYFTFNFFTSKKNEKKLNKMKNKYYKVK